MSRDPVRAPAPACRGETGEGAWRRVTPAPPCRCGTVVVAALIAIALASCARAPGGPHGPGFTAPVADSATIVLWRMDESGGYDVNDAGLNSIDGIAGRDTQTDFGRYGTARVFTESIESFIYAPYTQAFESPDQLTVEAWVNVSGYGSYEDTPIACRWSELPNEQSWLFAVVGAQNQALASLSGSPGFHQALTRSAALGHLLFAYQPADASLPVSFSSTLPLERDRWVHVAVTFDGRVVRFYLDDRLDSQFAVSGRIRPSHAPLLVGNYFDTRALTDFGGTLHVGSGVDRTAYYAFEGLMDELRISSIARDRSGSWSR